MIIRNYLPWKSSELLEKSISKNKGENTSDVGTLFIIKKSSNFDLVRFASCRKRPLIISLETNETINVKKYD